MMLHGQKNDIFDITFVRFITVISGGNWQKGCIAIYCEHLFRYLFVQSL